MLISARVAGDVGVDKGGDKYGFGLGYGGEDFACGLKL